MNTDPKEIRLDVAANTLTITWADGHVSTYDGAYLRYTCPCAKCRGHSDGEVPPPTWPDVKDTKVTHAEAVGAYALRFEFSDGHPYGMYSFDHLRATCPSERSDFDETGHPLPPGETTEV